MVLKPPVWGDLFSAVPQRTAGYAPAQEGAAVSPSAQSQPAPRNPTPPSQSACPASGNQQPNGVPNSGMAAPLQPQSQQRRQQNGQPQGATHPAQQRPVQGYQQPNRIPNGSAPAPQQAHAQQWNNQWQNGQAQGMTAPPQRPAQGYPQPNGAPNGGTPAPQQSDPQQQNGYAYAQGGQPNSAPAPQSQQVQPKAVQRQGENRQRSYGQNRHEPTFVHRKIWTIGGRKKFIDFVDKLSLAYVADFANIHGIGGKDHNFNSVIGVKICDYTNGTGAGYSRTLRACLDVEDADQLYEAAKLARMGKLKPDSSLEIKWMDTTLRQMESWKQYPTAPDGTRAIPRGALNALFSTISNARATLMPLIGAPFYTYYTEKNQPWKKNEQTGLAPCYSLTINYSPFMASGEKSSYPWYIKIEEFDAPLIEQKNGSTAHKSSEAANKRYAFINLSCDDFWRAMLAVKRYIRNWEHHMTKPLFREAFQRLAAQQEAKNDN